jgi:hypothetical protein
MPDEQRATASEVEELIRGADEAIQMLIDDYEPLEAVYRTATTSTDQVTEVVNTSRLPRALITTATSAR